MVLQLQLPTAQYDIKSIGILFKILTLGPPTEKQSFPKYFIALKGVFERIMILRQKTLDDDEK